MISYDMVHYTARVIKVRAQMESIWRIVYIICALYTLYGALCILRIIHIICIQIACDRMNVKQRSVGDASSRRNRQDTGQSPRVVRERVLPASLFLSRSFSLSLACAMLRCFTFISIYGALYTLYAHYIHYMAH
jgi:hypothetical protein